MQIFLDQVPPNIEQALELIKQGSDKESKDSITGASVFSLCAQFGSLSQLKQIIALKPNLNSLCFNQKSPFDHLFQTPIINYDKVFAFLDYGVYVNTLDNNLGYSALMYACRDGNLPVISRLISNYDADYNQINSEGNSVMDICLSESRIEAALLLVKIGVSVNYRDAQNKTILMHACKHKNFNAIETLVFSGADVNLFDDYNKSAINYLLQDSSDILDSFPFSEIIISFLRNGFTPNFIDSVTSCSLLQYVCKTGSLEQLKLFLEFDSIDLNYVNGYKCTALDYVLNRRPICFEMAFLLFTYGVDVNLKLNCGGTMLHLAAESCRIDVIKDLLSRNANRNVLRYDGIPLDLSLRKKHLDGIVCLVTDDQINRICDNSTPLIVAVLKNNLKIVKKFVEGGALVGMLVQGKSARDFATGEVKAYLDAVDDLPPVYDSNYGIGIQDCLVDKKEKR